MDDYNILKNQFEKFISEKDLSKYTEEEKPNPNTSSNLNKSPYINRSEIKIQNVLNATIGSNSELLNTENLSFKHIEEELQNKNKQNKKKDALKLIDKIISEYGYGFQIVKIIITSVFLSVITNFIIFHVSSNLLVLQKTFASEIKMSPENIGIMLSCISYALRAFGCFSLIYLIKCFSRQALVISSLLIILSLSVLVTLSFNFWTYLAFVIFSCFSAGIIDPINSDVLCESLPIRLRGFFMCFFCLGSPLSQTIHFIFLHKIYAESKSNFQIVLLAGAFIILLFSIVIILLFEDSPRNLILREDLYKAHSQLEKLLKPPRALSDSEKNTLYIQMHYGLNNRLSKNFSSIFSPLFLRTTLLFIGIVICFKSADDGLSAVLTLYIRKILGTTDDNLIGLEGIKINAIGSLGPLVSGVLVEIKYLGRKITLMISAVLLLLCFVLFQVNLSNYVIWLGLLNVFCNASTSNVVTFITETYPTIFRDVSEGFFNCLGAAGSLIGNLAYMGLFTLGAEAPFYFQIGNSIISIVLVYFIKYETCRKELDVFSNNTDNNYILEDHDEEKHEDVKEEMKSLV